MDITTAKNITPSDFREQLQQAQAKLNILITPSPDNLPKGQIPCLVKDNIVTTDLPTTCASNILRNFKSPYEATVVSKLRAAGFWIAGKANLDEFAMGSSNETSAFGPVKNPVDVTRVPGGSSGGPAAAVAAGVMPFALGSDTGGSIRQPAAFCGVVGLKPTYGRVSRYGLVAMASSLDQIGPLTTTVEDCAKILSVIAGHDPNDATSLPDPVPDYAAEMKKGVAGLKFTSPRGLFSQKIDEKVEMILGESVAKLRKLNLDYQGTIKLPHWEYALPTYYIIQPAEVSANLARYDGVKYGFSTGGDDQIESIDQMYKTTRVAGFGTEVKRRIMLGTHVLSEGFREAYYDRARKVATLIKQDFDQAFEKVDVIITPTAPTVAFKIGEKIDDPLAMYMNDLLTVAANIAGLPAISIPCGMVDGLPVGLQIIGRQLGEVDILKVAYAFEQATQNEPWRQELADKQRSWQ
ncbi:TPA: Asp-tRNA(Asn)/Glu-tRNA(Gln) amidotransferase GatCAB subunit A [Patescibacteria group bacterium]|nr:Asp-tRNA(Asn)/Glu-tRNA(Gln) amidotransferase GatCAB subunit A [Patescibacteria group bacterium]